eukprot:2371777-Lingulodinium_polyedra.AAC.1
MDLGKETAPGKRALFGRAAGARCNLAAPAWGGGCSGTGFPQCRPNCRKGPASTTPDGASP